MNTGDKRFPALLCYAGQHVQNILGPSGVQRRYGLVGDYHLRVLHQQAGNRDPLLLPSGKPGRPLRGLFLYAYALQRLQRDVPLTGPDQRQQGLDQAPISQPTGQHVVENAELRHQVELLVDNAYKAGQFAAGS